MVDAASSEVKANIRLPVGCHSVLGIAVSPDGRYAFVSHLVGYFNLVPYVSPKGWISTNNLAIIDLDNLRLLCRRHHRQAHDHQQYPLRR